MHSLILSVLFFIGVAAFPQHDTQWREFSSSEGRFSALLPDEPEMNTIMTNTKKGRLLTRTVSSRDKEQNEFTVAWTEYQQADVEHRGTGKTFNKIRDALVAARSGKLLNESDVKFNGHFGRSVTFETGDGRLVTARFGFFKSRFYQVMAETRPQNVDAGERFLNSFKLLPG